MKKIVCTVLLSFSLLILFAQNGELAVDFSKYGTAITGPSYINRTIVKDLIHEIERVNRSKTPEELNEAILNSIEGTPFMNNDFTEGELYTVDGKRLENIMLRYNVFNDIMEVSFNESLFELSGELVKRVKLEDKTFDYLSYTIADKQRSGYLELLQEGEWRLYCYHAKKFKEAQAQKAMEDKPSPPEFRNLPLVYLVMNDERNTAIGFRNKKELANSFTDNNGEIRAYIKKHKLKHNNPSDLKELLKFVNTL